MSYGRPDGPFSSLLLGEYRVVNMDKEVQDNVQSILPILLASTGISKQGDRAVLRKESLEKDEGFLEVDAVLRSAWDSLVSPQVIKENQVSDFNY